MSTTDQPYCVQFQAKGLDIRHCHLVNLSAGGCGMEIQMADARHLEVGDVVDVLVIDHPDLPLVPLTAAILRMLGKVQGKTSGYVLVGMEFENITPFVQGLIAGHVTAHLAGELA